MGIPYHKHILHFPQPVIENGFLRGNCARIAQYVVISTGGKAQMVNPITFFALISIVLYVFQCLNLKDNLRWKKTQPTIADLQEREAAKPPSSCLLQAFTALADILLRPWMLWSAFQHHYGNMLALYIAGTVWICLFLWYLIKNIRETGDVLGAFIRDPMHTMRQSVPWVPTWFAIMFQAFLFIPLAYTCYLALVLQGIIH